MHRPAASSISLLHFSTLHFLVSFCFQHLSISLAPVSALSLLPLSTFRFLVSFYFQPPCPAWISQPPAWISPAPLSIFQFLAAISPFDFRWLVVGCPDCFVISREEMQWGGLDFTWLVSCSIGLSNEETAIPLASATTNTFGTSCVAIGFFEKVAHGFH